MNKSILKEYRIPFIIVTVILGLLTGVILCGYLFISSFISNPDVNTNINKYHKYIGENAKKEYKNKWDMDESIFPQSITDDMSVEDYKMVYDNPFDAQYLSYLVVKYDEDTYKNEVKRLETYKSDEYIGIYGSEGFDSKYKLLAMNSDSYYGFVYALTNKEDTIVYVEVIFCNYFMDFDYKKYIKEEYLPIGFNAENGNPYMFKNKVPKDTYSRKSTNCKSYCFNARCIWTS